MKNLKGAVPPNQDDNESEAAYFHNLGFVLMVIALILSVGTILVYFMGLQPSGYVYDEKSMLISPQMLIFLLVMSLVFLATGMGLIAVAKRLRKKPEKKTTG
jgi:hypothetical protein